jgi:predicted heme/steroid binding protein
MRHFTLEELSYFNGQAGAPAFIAYRGKVYDVSGSFLWQKGSHQVLHRAGRDLTDDFAQAPHGEDVFEGFPVVGWLELKVSNADNETRPV